MILRAIRFPSVLPGLAVQMIPPTEVIVAQDEVSEDY
jgi:hypothetical protein